jgi:hypothetical protein
MHIGVQRLPCALPLQQSVPRSHPPRLCFRRWTLYLPSNACVTSGHAHDPLFWYPSHSSDWSWFSNYSLGGCLLRQRDMAAVPYPGHLFWLGYRLPIRRQCWHHTTVVCWFPIQALHISNIKFCRFSTKRSLANGIGAAGSGLGALIYCLATEAMIQHLSLAWAFRILAILSFVVNTLCAIVVRDRNKQVGSHVLAFDVSLFKKPEFLLLLGYGFFSMLGYVVLLFSLPNYATSIGLTSSQGSVLAAVLNLGQGLGRPPIGLFSDSVGRINIAGLMTFLSGLFALVIWVFAKSYGVLIFYALIGGAVAGRFVYCYSTALR